MNVLTETVQKFTETIQKTFESGLAVQIFWAVPSVIIGFGFIRYIMRAVGDDYAYKPETKWAVKGGFWSSLSPDSSAICTGWKLVEVEHFQKSEVKTAVKKGFVTIEFTEVCKSRREAKRLYRSKYKAEKLEARTRSKGGWGLAPRLAKESVSDGEQSPIGAQRLAGSTQQSFPY